MTNRTISVCIPHYNNSMFMPETLSYLLTDDRICEIVIVDDNSKDVSELKNYLNNIPTTKIKIFYNQKNLGCYHNKIITVRMSTSEWCILLDSDNFIDKHYVDTLFDIVSWDNNTIYAPECSSTFPGSQAPNLDYSIYSDMWITKNHFISNFSALKFQCLINACNYFLPKDAFLNAVKDGEKKNDRSLIDCLDSAVLFVSWLCHNGKVKVVPNLKYKHRLHPSSNYMRGISRHYEGYVKNLLLHSIKTNNEIFFHKK